MHLGLPPPAEDPLVEPDLAPGAGAAAAVLPHLVGGGVPRRLQTADGVDHVGHELGRRPAGAGGDVAVALRDAARVLGHHVAPLGGEEDAGVAVGVAGEMGEHVAAGPVRQQRGAAGGLVVDAGEVGQERGVGRLHPLDPVDRLHGRPSPMRRSSAARSRWGSTASARASKRAVRAAAKETPAGTKRLPRRAARADEQRGPLGVVLQQAVHRGAPDPAVGRAVGVAHDAAVVDLVAGGADAAHHLVGGEHRADRQPAEAVDHAGAGLDGIVDLVAQHLVAAADAEHVGAAGARWRPASPPARSHARSATVAFVPGSTTRSGRPSSAGVRTRRTATPGSRARASTSVTLEMRGKRTTATSSGVGHAAGPAPGRGPSRARESSASRATHVGRQHRQDAEGRHAAAALQVGRRRRTSRAGSPRNLLITKPPHEAAVASSGSSATVPYSAANTPPRSMSPTTIGRQPGLGGDAEVGDVVVEQVDLGRPAGALAQHDVEAAAQVGQRVEHHRQQARAWRRGTRPPSSRRPGRPRTMTWLVRSPVGLSRIGFMATSGSTPAASACTPWARPISWPSAVT